jgi:hypothetical protein
MVKGRVAPLPFRSQLLPGTMTTVTERRFYVYAYLRKDGTPYYIGKGKGNRIRGKHSIAVPPLERQKILFAGLTETEAFEGEIALIHCLGRIDIGTGCLRNRTRGGDGVAGNVLTESSKEKIRKARAKQVITPEHGKAVSRALKGKPKSAEHRYKLSEASDPAVKARCSQIGWAKSPDRGAAISSGKLKPQIWFHPEHGEVVCPAKHLTERFGVNNLEKLKAGQIRHSKGWTWRGSAA